MIRGITEQDHEAKQRRVFFARRLVKRLWVVTFFALAAMLVVLFLEYERPFASRLAREAFGLVINRANRDRPTVNGSVVRLAGSKGYMITAVGGVLKDADLGKPVEVWFPWLARDQTLRGMVRTIHRPQAAPPEGFVAPQIAVVEFDVEAATRTVELWSRTVEALREATVEVWGVDRKLRRVAKLSTALSGPRIHAGGYLVVSLKAGDDPSGAAIVADGRLAAIVADVSQGDGRPPASDTLLAVPVAEIIAAITSATRR